jgi:hypothetical protein
MKVNTDVIYNIDVVLYNSELDRRKRYKTDPYDWSVRVMEQRLGKWVLEGRYARSDDALAGIEHDKLSGWVVECRP